MPGVNNCINLMHERPTLDGVVSKGHVYNHQRLLKGDTLWGNGNGDWDL